MNVKMILWVACAAMTMCAGATAKRPSVLGPGKYRPNYDESKVAPYTLEDPLSFADGRRLECPADWQERSGLPLTRFFNTSGQLYRSLGLKDKLPAMSREEQLDLLSGDGMLVKRPILIGKDFVLVGFREEQWRAALK